MSVCETSYMTVNRSIRDCREPKKTTKLWVEIYWECSNLCPLKKAAPSSSSSTNAPTSPRNGKNDEPLGLKIVYGGKLLHATVDVIIIHGLNGHWKDSFTDPESQSFWILDFLPKYIPNTRIFSYGYDARTHSPNPISQQTVHQHGQDLVTKLVQLRNRTKSSKTAERPIIFIAYSLGGIVLKSALLNSHNTTRDHLPQHRSIKLSTYAIIFVGTPQQGVDSTSIATFALNVGSVFVHTNSSYYKTLKKDSDWLQQQCSDFLSISNDFVTKCFYETKDTLIRARCYRMIVPRASAVLPGAVNQESFGMNKDHLSLVKFSHDQDEDFLSISAVLCSLVKEAPAKILSVWFREREIIRITACQSQSSDLYPQDPSSVIRSGSDKTALLKGLWTGMLITEDVMRRAAENGDSGVQLMTSLLERPGADLYITDKVLEAAVGNYHSGEGLMILLLERKADIVITEKMMKIAAANGECGKRLMMLLLQRRGAEVAVTEQVVKAAAANWDNGKEVMMILHQQRGVNLPITEEVVKAAAKNCKSGIEVMKILLEGRPNIVITNDVMRLAAANGSNGKQLITLLQERQHGSDMAITKYVR